MLLGDATMYKVSINALIKFEQGYQQESFVNHLFYLFQNYTFMLEPGKRIDLHHPIRKGEVKSYWFKTFSHKTFNKLWDLFYVNGQKRIPESLQLSEECISYWIMCDGSLAKDNKTFILHSQSYSFEENVKLSTFLNVQWGFQTKVININKNIMLFKYLVEIAHDWKPKCLNIFLKACYINCLFKYYFILVVFYFYSPLI